MQRRCWHLAITGQMSGGGFGLVVDIELAFLDGAGPSGSGSVAPPPAGRRHR